MNARAWQAIIFDLDDTLYPERDYVLSGFHAVANWSATQLGIPADEGFAELTRLFEQGVRGDTFNRWLAMYGQSSTERVAQLVRVYREHIPTIVPFPQVTTLLDSLRLHYRLGLVSDGYLDVQRRKLDALGLVDRFDAIVFSDEWGRAAWKPNPKPFQVVLERLEIRPTAAVYVADNPLKDFLGARKIGIYTIQIRTPYSEYGTAVPPTLQHAPDLLMESFTDLQKYLAEKEM